MPSVPNFRPSQNAPLFENGPWPPGFNLVIDVLGLPPVPVEATRFGLCGGMAFLTRDIFEAGAPQLRWGASSSIPGYLLLHIYSGLRRH